MNKRATTFISRMKDVFKHKFDDMSTVPVPPYRFITQIGDPVLRQPAQKVDPAKIKTPEIQKIMRNMSDVMVARHAVGISAAQVGCPLAIMMVRFPEKFFLSINKELINQRRYKPFPLKVFINPEMRVIDSTQRIFSESCLSINGFSADVPRYAAVEIKGLNSNAQEVTWECEGWPARLVQHEMDHLNGKMYIDSMVSTTFQFDLWEYIQRRREARKWFSA